jgi:hypothetical protein
MRKNTNYKYQVTNKFQITNSKSQKNPKFQIQTYEQELFISKSSFDEFLRSIYLFVICILGFVIYNSKLSIQEI